MRLERDQIFLSASDLMRFQGCEHAIALDLRYLRGEHLTPQDLPLNIRGETSSTTTHESQVTVGSTLKEIEREWITRTLAEVNGNRTHAAKILGITRKTLQNKIREYGLSR